MSISPIVLVYVMSDCVMSFKVEKEDKEKSSKNREKTITYLNHEIYDRYFDLV